MSSDVILSKLFFLSHELSWGPGMVMGYSKMHCSMAITALSIFGAILKIALTGVRRRVREALQNGYSNSFNSVLLAETYLFPCKMYLPTI